MTNKEAIEWLKIAVPIKALTHKEFENFIITLNIAMDALEAKEEKPGGGKSMTNKEIKTNRDYIIAALQGEFDDGGATEEAEIYYHIKCPYTEGDQRAECKKLGKNISWETCTECKTKWLDSEPDE